MDKTEKILRKLDLYRKEPDIVQPLSNTDLADLVVVVLSQVRMIESAIKEHRLDGKTPEPDKDYLSKKAAVKMLTDEVNNALSKYDKEVTNRTSQYDEAVRDAIERLSTRVNSLADGKDGVVTEAEIQRAADIALGMVKLPDFDAMVTEAITVNSDAIRNALELLSDDNRYKVEIADVQGLADILNQLAQLKSSSGGTIGKNQVYNFIRQAIADGTIDTGGATTLDALDDVNVPTPSTNDVLTWDGAEWIATPPPGAGGGEANTVSNVGVGGVGLYKTKVGVDIKLKNINAGSAKVTITDDTGNDEVDIDIDPSEIATSELNNDAGWTGPTDISGKQNILAEGAFVDGDKTKLDGIETGADVTDATNVTAAGALMDSEVTNLTQVKAFDSSAYATAAQGATADAAPAISSGAGVPSSTPTKVGDIYIDTTSDDAYIAVGTASSSDWEKSNDGGGGGGVTDLQGAFDGGETITIANTDNQTLSVIQNDTTNNPKALSITNAGTGNALYIDANGNTGTSDSSSGALLLDATGISAGYGANFYTNRGSSGSSLGALMFIKADHIDYDSPVVYIVSDSENGAAADIRIDSPDPDIEFINTQQTSPAGDFEIGVPTDNDCFGISGRNAGNTAFETGFQFHRLASGGGLGINVNYSTPEGMIEAVAASGMDFLNLSTSVASSGNVLSVDNSGNVVINDRGNSVDVRIEGDTDTNLLVTDGSSDRVGIGVAAPTEKLDVSGNIKASGLVVYGAARGKVTAGGNLGATETVNFNSETNYTGTLDSNVIFTFANATSGDEMTLFLTYSGAQRTITWPTVTWLDNATGAAPTTPSASGEVLVVTVRYIGTTYYASATGNYAAYA